MLSPVTGVMAHARSEMMNMGMWLAILLGASLAAVVGFKALTKRSFLSGRTPSPLEDIHALVKEQVSLETLKEVWSVIGKAYSIDPQLIRPTDTFTEFRKIDSWSLGKGEDDIGKWVEQKGLKAPPQLQTVLDFARWVDSSAVVAVSR